MFVYYKTFNDAVFLIICLERMEKLICIIVKKWVVLMKGST